MISKVSKFKIIPILLLVIFSFGALYALKSFQDQNEFLERVTDPTGYGQITFLKNSSPESKYFNLYPLENKTLLPCHHSVFKLEDRIQDNLTRRRNGDTPPYVNDRLKHNLSKEKDSDDPSKKDVEESGASPAMTALGSGFVLNEKFIITNHHLVEKAGAKALFFDKSNDLAALHPILELNGRVLNSIKTFGSYELSLKSTEESIGVEVVIEGFQMHEILRLEGHLEHIDDHSLGILLNPVKGSVYWGVVSGLSGSPVLEKKSGRVIGVARSAGVYTNEDFPLENEWNTYVRIIDVDTLREFLASDPKKNKF